MITVACKQHYCCKRLMMYWITRLNKLLYMREV